MSPKKEGEHPEHGAGSEGVVRVFNRSRSFVEEVLRENERLRYKNLHLEQEQARARPGSEPKPGASVARENEQLRGQLERIKAQFDALARENEDFRSRYQEVERQNESLMNLYVSAFQLHATLDEGAALGVVKEILLNLVGADVFAIWLPAPGSGELELVEVVDESGRFPDAAALIPPAVWKAAVAGDSWFAAAGDGAGGPLCCVPLKVDERPAGALAIFRLLEQKSGFTDLDQELLGLLGGQAAAALIGARTFARSGPPLAPLPPTPPAGRARGGAGEGGHAG